MNNMKTFLLYDSETIINAIIAETEEDAKNAVGNNIFEYDENNHIWIGWKLYDGEWRPEQPYPSWTWNNDSKEWICPKPMPQNTNSYEWKWNEENKEWEQYFYPQPYPSWTLDENNVWQPPIPVPDYTNDYLWDEQNQQWVLVI